MDADGSALPDIRVKHLNPRQGITTNSGCDFCAGVPSMCETPKSPPGDYNFCDATTVYALTYSVCVKHLNPRQGITTRNTQDRPPAHRSLCETPKSPPGDYNVSRFAGYTPHGSTRCETPKSPPGDYNTSHSPCDPSGATRRCETPKSPPGDYNMFNGSRVVAGVQVDV